MTHRQRLVLTFALGIVPSAFLFAQAPGQPASPPAAATVLPGYRNRLLGVFDELTGDPIEGLEVRDLLNGTSSTTTATGTVGLFFLPDGGGMVRLRKLGYATQTFFVAVSPADTTPLTVTMSNAVSLPAVVTTEKGSNAAYASSQLKAVEERSRMGFGRYLMYEDIRKNDYLPLASLLRRIGGLSVVSVKGASYAVSTRCTAGANGQALSAPGSASDGFGAIVFLDGVKLGPTDLNTLVTTTEVAAVEFYTGGAETPEEFLSMGSGCGVLLIWTRVK